MVTVLGQKGKDGQNVGVVIQCLNVCLGLGSRTQY